jgi:hypothetical protein
MLRLLAVAAVAVMLSPVSFARSRAVRHPSLPWQAPACEVLHGLLNLRAIPNLSDTFPRITTTEDDYRPYVSALKAAAAANTLYATNDDGGIHQSVDAGCTWTTLTTTGVLFRQREVGIVAKHIAPVYIHTPYDVVRITREAIEIIPIPGDIIMMDVSPANPLQLRSLGRDGVARESQDGGSNWSVVGSLAATRVDIAVVDPTNFDHVLAASGGALHRSRDGGRTWTAAFGPGGEVLALAISPVDPRFVWMKAHNGPFVVGVVRSFYVSDDGGETFRVLRSAAGCSAGDLAPHPTAANVVALYCGAARLVDSNGIEWKAWGYDPTAYEMTYSPAGTLYYARSIPGPPR